MALELGSSNSEIYQDMNNERQQQMPAILRRYLYSENRNQFGLIKHEQLLLSFVIKNEILNQLKIISDVSIIMLMRCNKSYTVYFDIQFEL